MLKNILTWTLLLAAAQAPGWAQSVGPVSVREDRPRAGALAPDVLTGSPSGYEAFVKGAVVFEHAGRKYALKTIFSRARYDAGIDTYRAGLRYQFSDYTESDNISFWIPINPETSPVTDYRNNYDGTKFRIVSGDKYVEISAETNGKVKKYKFSVKEMLENWQENAKNYRRELDGAVWHFVPQVVWQPRGGLDWYSRGFAIGGETPLDSYTGRPLDGVRTCTSQSNWHGCTVGQYALSVASGLVISADESVPGMGATAYAMGAESLRVFMRDELDGKCGHSNCEKTGFEMNDW